MIPTSKLKDGLFLGDDEAAQDFEFIVANKITGIINCAALEVANQWESPGSGVEYLSFHWGKPPDREWKEAHFPIYPKGRDDTDVLDELVGFIDATLAQGESVLIHSTDGLSRAPFCASLYFMSKYAWTFKKTVAFLERKRPETAIHPRYRLELEKLDALIGRDAADFARCSTWDVGAVGDDASKNAVAEQTYEEALARLQAMHERQQQLQRTPGGARAAAAAAAAAQEEEEPFLEEYDEQLLAHTFINSEARDEWYAKHGGRPTPSELSVANEAAQFVERRRAIKWIDEKGRSEATCSHTAVPVSPVSRRPVLERPPNASYCSLALGREWGEVAPQGRGVCTRLVLPDTREEVMVTPALVPGGDIGRVAAAMPLMVARGSGVGGGGGGSAAPSNTRSILRRPEEGSAPRRRSASAAPGSSASAGATTTSAASTLRRLSRIEASLEGASSAASAAAGGAGGATGQALAGSSRGAPSMAGVTSAGGGGVGARGAASSSLGGSFSGASAAAASTTSGGGYAARGANSSFASLSLSSGPSSVAGAGVGGVGYLGQEPIGGGSGMGSARAPRPGALPPLSTAPTAAPPSSSGPAQRAVGGGSVGFDEPGAGGAGQPAPQSLAAARSSIAGMPSDFAGLLQNMAPGAASAPGSNRQLLQPPGGPGSDAPGTQSGGPLRPGSGSGAPISATATGGKRAPSTGPPPVMGSSVGAGGSFRGSATVGGSASAVTVMNASFNSGAAARRGSAAGDGAPAFGTQSSGNSGAARGRSPSSQRPSSSTAYSQLNNGLAAPLTRGNSSSVLPTPLAAATALQQGAVVGLNSTMATMRGGPVRAIGGSGTGGAGGLGATLGARPASGSVGYQLPPGTTNAQLFALASSQARSSAAALQQQQQQQQAAAASQAGGDINGSLTRGAPSPGGRASPSLAAPAPRPNAYNRRGTSPGPQTIKDRKEQQQQAAAAAAVAASGSSSNSSLDGAFEPTGGYAARYSQQQYQYQQQQQQQQAGEEGARGRGRSPAPTSGARVAAGPGPPGGSNSTGSASFTTTARPGTVGAGFGASMQQMAAAQSQWEGSSSASAAGDAAAGERRRPGSGYGSGGPPALNSSSSAAQLQQAQQAAAYSRAPAAFSRVTPSAAASLSIDNSRGTAAGPGTSGGGFFSASLQRPSSVESSASVAAQGLGGSVRRLTTVTTGGGLGGSGFGASFGSGALGVGATKLTTARAGSPGPGGRAR